ncbi:hypothetical protein DL93DRAFT_2093779 [Clavulina sp. PMI_390]|nr:hypothetical protein DL93DRAFT_2093779 [Clavulina sp. PMI_390]
MAKRQSALDEFRQANVNKMMKYLSVDEKFREPWTGPGQDAREDKFADKKREWMTTTVQKIPERILIVAIQMKVFRLIWRGHDMETYRIGLQVAETHVELFIRVPKS